MFEKYKEYKFEGSKAMSLEELIEMFGDKYFFEITYHSNGRVSIFFGSERNKSEKESEQNEMA